MGVTWGQWRKLEELCQRLQNALDRHLDQVDKVERAGVPGLEQRLAAVRESLLEARNSMCHLKNDIKDAHNSAWEGRVKG